MIRTARIGFDIHAVDENDLGVTLCFRSTRDAKRIVRGVPVTCGECRAAMLGPRFAFCENVTASSMSAIHIRILTGRGLAPSGAADTPALCGHGVAWDIHGIVNEATVADDRTCVRCRSVWRGAVNLGN